MLSLTNSLLAVIASLLLLVYFRTKKHLRYFRNNGIPGPEPSVLFGTVRERFGQATFEYDKAAFKKYGPIYGTFEGREPCLHIADPKLLKNIFVKDFDHFMDRRISDISFGEIADKLMSSVTGDEWRGIRQLTSPAFSTGKLKKMVELMGECAENLVKHFKTRNDSNSNIIVKDLYGGYSMDVVATCGFGTKLDSLGKEDDPFVKNGKKMCASEDFESPFWLLMYLIPSWAERWIMPLALKPMMKVMSFYQKVVEQILEQRNGEPSGRGDFLDIMLEEKRKANQEDEIKSLKTKVATHQVIVAQALLFFTAGFDSVATVLTWASYHLATDDEIQENVYQEVIKHHRKHGGFTYEMICDLTCLDMVILETLRLRTPVTHLERQCSKKTEYEGLTIEEMMLIRIPVMAIHHNEHYYPQPLKFIPERFEGEAKRQRDPYTFLPFGQGPRNCIGMRFALEETKVALAHLIYNFRFVTTAETKIELLKNTPFNIPKRLKLGIEVRG